MMNCHDATFLMSQQRERRLSLVERLRMRLHALVCPACQHFEDQLPMLGAAARRYAAPVDVRAQDNGTAE